MVKMAYVLSEGYGDDVIVRFYPDTPITCYPYSYCDRDFKHLHPADFQERERSGKPMTWRGCNMDYFQQERLAESIRAEGVRNPFIIEYYRKDRPNYQGIYDTPRLAIRTGNNRACVMEMLGMERAKALFVVPAKIEHLLPDDPFEDLPLDSRLESRLNELWCEVARADTKWKQEAWRDSNLLLDIIRRNKDGNATQN